MRGLSRKEGPSMRDQAGKLLLVAFPFLLLALLLLLERWIR